MIKPASEAELAEAVASAKGPLRIQGGGTRPIGNPVEGDLLTTLGMSGITLYEPGALTIVAQAGTPLAEIEAALDAENQMLPFEPMDHRTLLGTSGTPTIGGVVGANVSGPRRVQAGACRDSLIGVRYVNGEGTIIKNGGRVMKNVTGYDLVKLMAGSYGTLGVMSEVSFKVLPKPDTETTLVIQSQNQGEAVEAMATALSSPFEVSGVAHGPVGHDGAPTYVRIEGFEASVKYRTKALSDTLGRFGDITEQSEDASRALWKNIRDVNVFADHAAVTRLSLKASDLPELYFAAANVFSDDANKPAFDIALDWGGGLAWFASKTDLEVDGDSFHAWLQSHCAFAGGHATRFKGQGDDPAFQPEVAPLAKLANDLRAQFDPKGILNPGLMG